MKYIIYGSLFLLATAEIAGAQVVPLHWTMLQELCVPDSGKYQCAINLLGKFQNKSDCVSNNGGQVDLSSKFKGDKILRRRCEILLENFKDFN